MGQETLSINRLLLDSRLPGLRTVSGWCTCGRAPPRRDRGGVKCPPSRSPPKAALGQARTTTSRGFSNPRDRWKAGASYFEAPLTRQHGQPNWPVLQVRSRAAGDPTEGRRHGGSVPTVSLPALPPWATTSSPLRAEPRSVPAPPRPALLRVPAFLPVPASSPSMPPPRPSSLPVHAPCPQRASHLC